MWGGIFPDALGVAKWLLGRGCGTYYYMTVKLYITTWDVRDTKLEQIDNVWSLCTCNKICIMYQKGQYLVQNSCNTHIVSCNSIFTFSIGVFTLCHFNSFSVDSLHRGKLQFKQNLFAILLQMKYLYSVKHVYNWLHLSHCKQYSVHKQNHQYEQ